MRKQIKDKQTFRQIVDEVAQDNFQGIMARARQFSRLAKTVHGNDRRLAYYYKNMCLKHLIETCSTVKVQRDLRANDFELLSVRVGMERLHTKLHWLGGVA